MSKIHVLLVYGGQSSEHDVSLMSARNVFAALDNNIYDVTLCLIDREGKWWLQETVDDAHTGRPQLLPALGQKRFVTIPDHHIVQPDVLFPVLHGSHGEDGTVQGLTELIGIPCVGPTLLGAAITIDKDTTKRLMEHEGIPIVPWRVWEVKNGHPDYDEVSSVLGEKLFVKPASAGSSIGVGKVTSRDGWKEVLNVAAKHAPVVLIEKAIEAREIELAVLGDNHVQVSGAGEVMSGEEFYSYDDKYAVTSQARVVIPANIDEQTLRTLQGYAEKAYKVAQCQGMARIDFFLDEQNNVYLNEINSIPGFTNISMYPKLWREAGISYPSLLNKLIGLALERTVYNDKQI